VLVGVADAGLRGPSGLEMRSGNRSKGGFAMSRRPFTGTWDGSLALSLG
jgi:hypothetical protein